MRRPQFTIGMLIRATLFVAVAVAGLTIPIEMEESNQLLMLIYDAQTPFTTYCRIQELCSTAQANLLYCDR